MSALPPKADILEGAAKRLLLTQSGRSLEYGNLPITRDWPTCFRCRCKYLGVRRFLAVGIGIRPFGPLFPFGCVLLGFQFIDLLFLG